MTPPIPTTLDEAIDALIASMSPADLAWFKDPANSTASLHHGPGTAMRNEWSLWEREQPSPLVKWFRERGIWHADDMSEIIFGATKARLTGQPFDLAARTTFYADFWRTTAALGFDGVPILGLKPASSFNVFVKR